MALTLLLGPSGSGKTTYLYKHLMEKAEHSSAFQAMAVVPEQYTMQTQKDLVLLHTGHSVTNVDILSFDRLAYRIIEELGTETLTVLDDMGKTLVLRRAAARCSEALPVFGRNIRKAGFIDKVKSLLSELYQYRIDEKELDRLIAETEDEPLLNRKLLEIRTLYRAFDEGMAEDTIPSERLYDVLCRLIPRSQIIKNCVITFDGFTGFTPVQFAVLEVLMRHAREIVVCVTVDADLAEPPEAPAPAEGESARERARHASDAQLFDMSLTMVRSLKDLAEKNGVPVRRSLVFSPGARFSGAPALAHLEREFLRCPAVPFEGEVQDIRLWETKNREEEVTCAAREIFSLVRNEGLRFRDIALIVSDLTGYEPTIRRVFARAGIPVFIDVKHNMTGHPLVAFLRGALESVEQDFSYETVFGCLKSGMMRIEEDDLYELENYVLALGIRGRKAWSGDWEATYSEAEDLDLEHLNEVRKKAAEPLLALREAMKREGACVRDFAEALVVLMESQDVAGRLSEMADSLTAGGESRLGDEYTQSYGKVLDLLDRVVDLYGDAVVSPKEWREILDTGFSEIRVGVIPAYVDRVVAGDMHRTRLKDPSVLFFLGANDGLVPQTGDSGSLLSDLDRMSLERHGVRLAPTKQENAFIDRYYLYLTLVRPSRRLYVSWCSQNADGGALSPSYLVGELKNLFPALRTEHPEETATLPERVLTRETAGEAMREGLPAYLAGTQDAAWEELYSLFAADETLDSARKQLLDAALKTYREESMGPAVAKALYGAELEGSVTRLEQYASCAYSQFLAHGLRLTERREHTFQATDLGTLLHEVIQRFFAKVYAGDGPDRIPEEEVLRDEEKRNALVHLCMEEALLSEGDRGLSGTARGAYLCGRIERIADRTLWALCEQLARGDFRPENVEVEFDGRGSSVMNRMLDDDTRMRLHGRIDRVDTCETDEAVYVKVVDYKSGNTSLDLKSVYDGLQLQLAVYLDAAMERERQRLSFSGVAEKNVYPAGILYYNIKDPYITENPGESRTADDQSVQDAILGELAMSGLVNRDPAIYRRMDHLVGSGAPAVIPVKEKEGEAQESRSSLADNRQFEALCSHVRRKLSEFGSAIMAGDLSVNPYELGGATGCDYCPYLAVCGFDRKVPGYGFRRVAGPDNGEIWQALLTEEREDEEQKAAQEQEEAGARKEDEAWQ